MEIKSQNIWDKLFNCKSFAIKKCLVANELQLKNLSHMFWLPSHLEKYINKVFCLYNFIFKNMDKLDEPLKTT
jgi:hypothetical protein